MNYDLLYLQTQSAVADVASRVSIYDVMVVTHGWMVL